MLKDRPGLEFGFMPEYHAAYSPGQLSGYDVVISLKPRVTAASLEGITELCAIGRCGVGYDNVDLRACTEKDIAVYITPAGRGSAHGGIDCAVRSGAFSWSGP